MHRNLCALAEDTLILCPSSSGWIQAPAWSQDTKPRGPHLSLSTSLTPFVPCFPNQIQAVQKENGPDENLT